MKLQDRGYLKMKKITFQTDRAQTNIQIIKIKS